MVCVGVGTNVERETLLRAAVQALGRTFGELRLSSVVESPPWGMAGDDFYNLVVAFESDLSPLAINTRLKEIERDNTATGQRGLDLDLLLVGELHGDFDGITLPREDVLKYPFVLGPLAELLGEQRHPVCGRSYAELWEAYDKQGLDMTPVGMQW